MIGMLQIITYLLCVYLVFKAVEILQIGLMSANEARAKTGRTIGILALIASILLAVGFIFWIDFQASLSENIMQSMPTAIPR